MLLVSVLTLFLICFQINGTEEREKVEAAMMLITLEGMAVCWTNGEQNCRCPQELKETLNKKGRQCSLQKGEQDGLPCPLLEACSFGKGCSFKNPHFLWAPPTTIINIWRRKWKVLFMLWPSNRQFLLSVSFSHDDRLCHWNRSLACSTQESQLWPRTFKGSWVKTHVWDDRSAKWFQEWGVNVR